MYRLGLSMTRPDPTNCPEPDHLHPKPPDQSLVSVGRGSPAHGPESIGSSCGLASEKPTNPTRPMSYSSLARNHEFQPKTGKSTDSKPLSPTI